MHNNELSSNYDNYGNSDNDKDRFIPGVSILKTKELRFGEAEQDFHNRGQGIKKKNVQTRNMQPKENKYSRIFRSIVVPPPTSWTCSGAQVSEIPQDLPTNLISLSVS